MLSCDTTIGADKIMDAGMGRFILLSTALHLGMLAALGYNPVRPPLLLPSTLTVTLNVTTVAAAIPQPHTARPTSASKMITRGPVDTQPTGSEAATDSPHETPEGTAPPTLAHENLLVADNHPAALDTSPLNPSLEENGKLAAAQPSADAMTRPTDITSLASQLAGQLRDALTPYFAYPMLARRNGWQGRVQIGLRVEADGRLSHVRIAHSSGYRLLDNAALATLNRINTLPDAASWLDGRHFDMVLPIEYHLIDGQS